MKWLKTTAYENLSGNLAEKHPSLRSSIDVFLQEIINDPFPSQSTQNKLSNGTRISFGLFIYRFDSNFVWFTYTDQKFDTNWVYEQKYIEYKLKKSLLLMKSTVKHFYAQYLYWSKQKVVLSFQHQFIHPFPISLPC